MAPSSAIVSYHPALEADENLLLISQRPLDGRDEEALGRAAAVFLPQLCRPDLLELVKRCGTPHFPRPEAQLFSSGKLGNHLLFSRLGLPQPLTRCFNDLDEALAAWRDGGLAREGLEPPLVVKGAGGGEGQNVFLVHDLAGLEALRGRVEPICVNGPSGLALQEYVECGGRDVRVIIMGHWHDVFWREGGPGDFRANLSQGGRVVRGREPERLAQCLALALELKEAAGLDIAAVDLLAPEGREPLLLEINFYFGRKALGGSQGFLERYLQAARGWLAGLGLDPHRVRLSDDV